MTSTSTVWGAYLPAAAEAAQPATIVDYDQLQAPEQMVERASVLATTTLSANARKTLNPAAARVLKAAAAQITKGYGRHGHFARRQPLSGPSDDTIDDAVDEMHARGQARRAATTSATALPTMSQDFPSIRLGRHKFVQVKKTCKASSFSTSASSSKSTSKVASSSSSSMKTSSRSSTSSTTKAASSSSTRSASSSSSTRSASSTSTKSASSTASTKSSSSSTSTAASSYSTAQVVADMTTIMTWAGDLKQMNSSQKTETVAALLSAAGRYFPELQTRDAVRYLLADIKAESDFNATAYNGGREDSGESLGLMQVSPSSGAQELPLWMGHSRVSYNNYSWSADIGPAGPLLDYSTGKVMSLASLTRDDLFRPWVNIHLGAWVQSNLARTASCDPYSWEDISYKAHAARVAEANYNASSSTSTTSSLYTAMTSAQKAEKAALVCGGVTRSVKTGLGSWVAGPAVDGDASYTQSGDDVSAPYFSNIMAGVKVLFNDDSLDESWLDGLVLTAGVVDYRETDSLTT